MSITPASHGSRTGERISRLSRTWWPSRCRGAALVVRPSSSSRPTARNGRTARCESRWRARRSLTPRSRCSRSRGGSRSPARRGWSSGRKTTRSDAARSAAPWRRSSSASPAAARARRHGARRQSGVHDLARRGRASRRAGDRRPRTARHHRSPVQRRDRAGARAHLRACRCSPSPRTRWATAGMPWWRWTSATSRIARRRRPSRRWETTASWSWCT